MTFGFLLRNHCLLSGSSLFGIGCWMASVTMTQAKDAIVERCLCGIACILVEFGQSAFNLVHSRLKNWIDG